MALIKTFIVILTAAFIGFFLAYAFLIMWQLPLLYTFGLERAALEEMRVLIISILIGTPLGLAIASIPRPKPKNALTGVISAVFLFSVMWLIPLLLPMGSEPRLGWEEMRVVAVGLALGTIAGYTLGWAIKHRHK
ncbi:hypothetical protein GX563_09450 [Candidatus Bathyarchaeota archaeon]|nr:hypothetical protein [Candidatus Bathyarchaeota archaeon]